MKKAVGGTLALTQAMNAADVHCLIFSSSATVYSDPDTVSETGTTGQPANPYGTSKLMIEQILRDLVPNVSQVAVGQREVLSIFGDDYPTVDGTGVRDYIHVVNLARGHVRALEHLGAGCRISNLGTGRGCSVREVVAAFEKAAGQSIPVRRPRDYLQP